VLGLALAGCGASKGTVKGKLLKGGKPLEVPKGAMLNAQLIPTDAKASRQPITPDTDGSFQLLGTDGKGVPAGKYKFVATMPNPAPSGADAFGGQFTEANTKITVDVKPGQDLLIDLDKP
jgi:hypothetical protein